MPLPRSTLWFQRWRPVWEFILPNVTLHLGFDIAPPKPQVSSKCTYPVWGNFQSYHTGSSGVTHLGSSMSGVSNHSFPPLWPLVPTTCPIEGCTEQLIHSHFTQYYTESYKMCIMFYILEQHTDTNWSVFKGITPYLSASLWTKISTSS